jgi:hypothetical protein
MEITLSEMLEQFIGYVRDVKPNDRSEKDRKFAVALTDLEKVSAYIKTYLENEE